MNAVLKPFFAPYKDWTLYAGFSGGADSLALLLMLEKLRHQVPFRLVAVHCEHGLRGEASLADAAFCREICHKYGVEFLLFELDVPQKRLPGESVETAARRLRQEVWQNLAGQKKQTAVVLAHHAGDRRENLLLRLGRGSGSSGLTGLRSKRMLNGVLYLRPLLKMERSQLEVFLRESGEVCWREDASNSDICYRRNFIHQELIPQWEKAVPGVRHGLDAALDALETEADFLEELAGKYVCKIRRSGGAVTAWQKVPAALHGRVLRKLAKRDLQTDWIPGRAFQAVFRDWVIRGMDGALPLSGIPGCRWVFRNGTGCFERLNTVPQIRHEWQWRTMPLERWQVTFPTALPEKIALDEAYFDAALLPETLLVSSGADGDVLIPFGRRNPVKWKRLRVDRKVPRSAAPPLLRMPDGTVLWSPLIRHTAHAPVSRNTREIVCFHWMKGR